MKKMVVVVLLSLSVHTGKGQSEEFQQLLLNIEKLAQLVKILDQLYDGYKILKSGYGVIKNLSEGNFKLHQHFLDGLLQVSPAVRNYRRVKDILHYQWRIVREYKAAWRRFREDGQFTPAELEQMARVYRRLTEAGRQSLDELALIVTAGKLRMSDDERIGAIDRIYQSVVDQYSFLQEFNNEALLLRLQRQKEQWDLELSRKLNKLNR